MKSFSFIHAADLHLDAPFRGVSSSSPAVAKALSEATFNAYDALIATCIERKVDFLLVAGDIFNSSDRSLRAQLRFRDGLKKLQEHNISAYVVYGNHDPLDGWSYSIDWPSNMHIFSGDDVETIFFAKNEENIATISGMSYKKREEKRNLAKLFSTEKETNLYSIGLLHCTAGSYKEHEPYAPCQLDDLLTTSIDYWALGHVHTKQVLYESPYVVYPGNTQGLHINESGERGCYLVSVADNKTNLEFIATDTTRWFSCDINVSGFETMDQLENELGSLLEKTRDESDGKNSIVRVKLTGRTPLYRELVREGSLDELLELTRGTFSEETPFLWVQDIKLACKPEIDLKNLENKKGFSSQLLKISEELRAVEDFSEHSLAEHLAPLFEHKLIDKHIGVLDTEELKELIEEAKLLCIDRLEE